MKILEYVRGNGKWRNFFICIFMPRMNTFIVISMVAILTICATGTHGQVLVAGFGQAAGGGLFGGEIGCKFLTFVFLLSIVVCMQSEIGTI